MDPASSLVLAFASLLGMVAFALRAAQPYLAAFLTSAKDDREALDDCRADREALERRIRILEDRVNAR